MDYNVVIEYARKMRANPTQAESLFWEKVKGRKILGLKFLRQYIFKYMTPDNLMHFYIFDFYCQELKLAVEIDGKYHDNPIQRKLDQDRELILKIYGIKVIRFKNSTVIDKWEEVYLRLNEKVKEIDSVS